MTVMVTERTAPHLLKERHLRWTADTEASCPTTCAQVYSQRDRHRVQGHFSAGLPEDISIASASDEPHSGAL